jgi:hypothetical protein
MELLQVSLIKLNQISKYFLGLLKINSGHERTIRAKKNVIGLIIIKGLNIFVELLTVSVTIDY